MSNLALADIGQDGSMSSSGPRAGGPTPRRSFTPTQKLEFLAQYEGACTRHEGGAFLREQGLYSSQITEWRRLRDAGVFGGKEAGEKLGKRSPEQAEIARPRRQLASTKTFPGAPGTVAAVGAVVKAAASDAGAVPTALCAETVAVYAVPASSPPMVAAKD
jgi:transposase